MDYTHGCLMWGSVAVKQHTCSDRVALPAASSCLCSPLHPVAQVLDPAHEWLHQVVRSRIQQRQDAFRGVRYDSGWRTFQVTILSMRP